jgi:hypothetical protein
MCSWKLFGLKTGIFLVTPWDIQALELSSKQVEGKSCSISNCFATTLVLPLSYGPIYNITFG